MTSAIGWGSSLILLLTIGNQVWKQWSSGSSQGVSKWLFFGQTTASLGFCIYSVLQKDWVFVVTNSLMLLSSITGLLITLRNKARGAPTSPAFSEFGPVPDLRLEPAASANSPQSARRT